jgi:hypothetical protein
MGVAFHGSRHLPGIPWLAVLLVHRIRLAFTQRTGRNAPLLGTPIVPFVPTSSIGCAICDPVIAAWCFFGGPSVYRILKRKEG